MDTSDCVSSATSAGPGRLGSVTTAATSTPNISAKQLRRALVDHLRDQGTVRSPRVEAALRAVPRHVFVPAMPAEDAYADTPLYTKHDDAGMLISAAAQLTIVAMMLQQLQVESGHRVLEAGAGTGYNAALLGYLAGADGEVTTIDVDQDLVDGARAVLAAAGYANVRVVQGDGALGYPGGAPYDRIVATVGAHGVPLAWLNQLAAGGRLVVPLRLRGSVSRSIVFQHGDRGWRSVDSAMCTFMPLRGIAADPRHLISLTSDETVTLETHQDQTVAPDALADVLRQRRVTAWTGVRFGGMESMEWLYLWLACSMPNAISRMLVEQAAVDQGLIAPQFGWGAMATVEHRNLAYLTVRRHDRAADGDVVYELGVIGHGSGDDLVDRMVDAVQAWDQGYRSDTADFEIHHTAGDTPTDVSNDGDVDVHQSADVPGRFAIETPLNRVIVNWH